MGVRGCLLSNCVDDENAILIRYLINKDGLPDGTPSGNLKTSAYIEDILILGTLPPQESLILGNMASAIFERRQRKLGYVLSKSRLKNR